MAQILTAQILNRASLVAALAVGLYSPIALARGHDYQIDPVHSRIVVRAEHLGFSHAQGTVSNPNGWLFFDPRDFSTARAEVDIDLRRFDFGDAKWNEKLASRTWLQLESSPTARFVSEHIEPIDEHRFKAHGVLSFRGTSQPLTLNVRFNRLARHPLTLKRTAGFSATASFSRAAFGMDAWKSMVGDQIDLQIEVEAQRKRRPESTETAG
ncbi:YceI family protein [Pseudomarimonas arenosa]|uniref:YceI family protein n=1 Tax=Pseudomarimonas arenosa TaxID=2774145 RepID=A0AAW3ZJ12_9GAMM|nr:YceI family protein [Pseudomarimonas arenosa]MBD8525002.1 YceI family protein [Pseudomarimonas arenosa]